MKQIWPRINADRTRIKTGKLLVAEGRSAAYSRTVKQTIGIRSSLDSVVEYRVYDVWVARSSYECSGKLEFKDVEGYPQND
jgi:hypothetical protein